MTRRVAYYYDDEIGNYYYGPGHPMKPQVVRMTHKLIEGFRLDEKMACFRPSTPVTAEEFTKFHADDYIHFLETTENQVSTDSQTHALWKYNLGVDCPIFPGIFDYCQSYVSGSVAGAQRLNAKKADVAINWSGGMHHARKSSCVGMSPINDCVLAILELLKKHDRVLYIDVDAQHASGVEEAFYTTDRVLTLSFHTYAEDSLPGSGNIDDIGVDDGKGYSINFPFKRGADDSNFDLVYQPIVKKVMLSYQPNCIVYQSGANSLGGDRLGDMNLSMHCHASALAIAHAHNLPMLVLGGSGYTLRNAARCWAYETAVLVGARLPDAIPPHDYLEHYGPTYNLRFGTTYVDNENTSSYIDATLARVLANINTYVKPVVVNPEAPVEMNGMPKMSKSPLVATATPISHSKG